MTDLREANVPFENIGIDIPDYVKSNGSKATQPFSRSKHDLLQRETLGIKDDGDTKRTDYFKEQLVRLRNFLGKPVPYRFRDSRGEKRSMDAGCLKFVGPDGQDVVEFITENGYIVAVEPKPALIAAYAASIAEDIRVITGDPNLLETTRRQLIEARLGQGDFRRHVLALWNGRCALTGCDLEPVIRASHIVPWRSATNEERLDPANGLPLVATVDALFDRGLISFDGDGNVLFKGSLSNAHRMLIPEPRRLTGTPNWRSKAYLARHRQAYGFA